MLEKRIVKVEVSCLEMMVVVMSEKSGHFPYFIEASSRPEPRSRELNILRRLQDDFDCKSRRVVAWNQTRIA